MICGARNGAHGFHEIAEERTRIHERPGEHLQRRYIRLINPEERGWHP